MPVKPKFESAVLFVADVERSKQFYVNVLPIDVVNQVMSISGE